MCICVLFHSMETIQQSASFMIQAIRARGHEVARVMTTANREDVIQAIYIVARKPDGAEYTIHVRNVR